MAICSLSLFFLLLFRFSLLHSFEKDSLYSSQIFIPVSSAIQWTQRPAVTQIGGTMRYRRIPSQIPGDTDVFTEIRRSCLSGRDQLLFAQHFSWEKGLEVDIKGKGREWRRAILDWSFRVCSPPWGYLYI